MTTTPTLRDRLDAWCNTDDADLRDERLYHLLNAFTTKFEALEPPCPSTTGTPPESSSTNSTTTPIPFLGVNHQKCDRCGKPLPLAGPYYELCLCSAASAAVSGIGSGEPTTPPQPPSDFSKFSKASDLLREQISAPAEPPAVPAWCEDGQIDVYFLSTKEINSGVAALRASRDHWKTKATEWASRFCVKGSEGFALRTRIRDLEAAQARQTATITELRKALDQIAGDKPNPPEKPKSSCGCRVCTCEDPDRCHGCGARFCEKHRPTPPPEAKP